MSINSDSINITGIPELPNVGYYNKDIDKGSNSYNEFSSILTNNCTNLGTSGIYSAADVSSISTSQNIDLSKVSLLDVPYYLGKTNIFANSLNNAINNQITNKNTGAITNQMQYLICQLEKVRNRSYSGDSAIINSNTSLKTIFEKSGGLKMLLVALFVLTMYFCTAGFFGSMDLASNIFSLIEKNGDTGNIIYWTGLMSGIIVPIIVLCVMYSRMICKNLNDLDNFDITKDPYGIKNSTTEVSTSARNFDIGILVLFIFLIFAFIAALFTIKRSVFGDFIYTVIIGLILSIISVFLYIMYAFIPFFDSADTKNIGKKTEELRLFISNQEEVSNITTNQTQDIKVKKTFAMTAGLIIILGILFFVLKKSNPFINGFLSSSAILVLPILWVFNFLIAINYFYFYPILLIVIRFIRYIIMSILYIITEKNSSLKDTFSDDLSEQLNNFKNYSPPWGMIFVDELKLILNILGYDNKFSKQIIGDDNGKNISQNKFASSLMLGFLVNFIATKDKNNMSGIIYSCIVILLAIIISAIILYGIIKI
jgi:hypothetical protein